MDNFKLKQSGEQVQEAIDKALTPSTALDKSGQLADAKAVGDKLKVLSEAIEDLKENGVSGGGLNEEAANLLIHILRNATYQQDMSSQIERLEEILLGDSGGDTDSGLTITDDGNGNVVITTFGNATIIDDGNGNVTIPMLDGVTITDDGSGNVVIA